MVKWKQPATMHVSCEGESCARCTLNRIDAGRVNVDKPKQCATPGCKRQRTTRGFAYCDTCYGRGMALMVKPSGTCQQCGGRLKGKGRKFCSVACVGESQRKPDSKRQRRLDRRIRKAG